MENKNRAFEAIGKIEKIINEIKDLFPDLKKLEVKIATKKYSNPIQTLKRVSGIIVNYDESNAKMKLESLLKFLGVISHKEK